jgi:hypothetical protein
MRLMIVDVSFYIDFGSKVYVFMKYYTQGQAHFQESYFALHYLTGCERVESLMKAISSCGEKDIQPDLADMR